MYEYKEEILSSRVGNLGASDAELIARVASTGNIPKTAEKRLAVAKGLIPPTDGFKTEAMQLGDDIEMAIYEYLKSNDERWESNKLLTSRKFSSADLSLIAHIDFFLQDETTMTIKAIECKATKTSLNETLHQYRNQLFVEFILLKEYAASLRGQWKVKLSLCHYDTNDYIDFNPDKIELKSVIFRRAVFDIKKGMSILSSYVAGLTEYYPEDEVDAELLPAQIKEQFALMTTILTEIKEREIKVEQFKEKLYNFLQDRQIKSIKNDVFTITRVDPTESVSFDAKRFLSDYANEHPTKHKRLVKKYEKRVSRKGYAKITIK